MSSEPLAYALFAVYGSAAVIIVAQRVGVTLPSLISYVLALAIAFIRYAEAGLSAPDAIYYDRMAVAISEGQSSNTVSAGKEGLAETLAVLYKVLGHDPFYGLWLNAIACALMVAMLAAVAGRLDMPVTPTAWIAAIYPPVLFWGTFLLREAIVWLLISLMLFAAAGIVSRAGTVAGNVILLVLAFGALIAFRGSVAIALMAAILAAIVVAQDRNKNAGLGAYMLLIVVLGIAYMTPLADQIEGVFGRYSFERLEVSREALQRTADSGFSIGAGGPILSALTTLPRVLFGPFFWEIEIVGVPGVLEGLLWVGLLVLVARGFRRVPNPRFSSVLVLPSLTLLYVLAVTSGNYGTMVRLRTQVAIMLIPLAAAGVALARRPIHEMSRRSKRGRVASIRAYSRPDRGLSE
ncbi:hypothetical protein ABZ477_08870 [Microbacterium sp. NPDC019599]|uniref:hypothetical protein n=1 Tax=Microbacterium sp. NPDC019599 TaxID=3154690 RepID=UPI0033D89EC8